jgi:hypothetical protein
MMSPDTLYNSAMIDKLWIAKGIEWSGRGLIEIISQNFSGET